MTCRSKGNRLFTGWQLGTVLQVQSGSPVTILTGKSFATANVLRPDQLAPTHIVDQLNWSGNITWFSAVRCTTATLPTTSGCQLPDPGNRFGNMQRNAVEGPGSSTGTSRESGRQR